MWEADGRFLIGPGEVCHWGHRMTNTRDHAEIEEIRKVLKLDEKAGEKKEIQEDGSNEVETAKGSEMPQQEVNNAINTTTAQVPIQT